MNLADIKRHICAQTTFIHKKKGQISCLKCFLSNCRFWIQPKLECLLECLREYNIAKDRKSTSIITLKKIVLGVPNDLYTGICSFKKFIRIRSWLTMWSKHDKTKVMKRKLKHLLCEQQHLWRHCCFFVLLVIALEHWWDTPCWVKKNLSLIDSSLDRWRSDKESHGFILFQYTVLRTCFYAVEILFAHLLSFFHHVFSLFHCFQDDIIR